MRTEQGTKNAGTGYLLTLDGWRAIAVSAVVWFHAKLTTVAPLAALQKRGFLGVNLFFAISGILICSRLLQEEQARGHISLRGFYVRRSLRILPPAFTYLLLIAVLGYADLVRVSKGAWFAAASFVVNYYSVAHRDMMRSPFTNHFWSLSVEEHFYLLLPAALLVLRRHRMSVFLSVIALLMVRTFAILLHPAWLENLGGLEIIGWRTDVQLTSLLWPATLAIALQNQRVRAWAEHWIRLRFVLPASAIFASIGMLAARQLGIAALFFQFGVATLVFPLLLIATVLHPKGIAGRLLQWRPLRLVGRVSYSIYLYQQLFVIGQLANQPGVLGRLQSFPLNLLAVATCALGSYFLIEKPCMKLGHRLAPPVTPGREDLARESANRALGKHEPTAESFLPEPLPAQSRQS